MSVSAPSRSPALDTYLPSTIFTSTPTATMTRPTVLYSGVCGCKMLFIDSASDVTPAQSTMAETTIAVRYSMRPYP